ncbi:MAG: Response regulator receiver protein [Parcubacteria group bacterium GW2011_GWA2_40_8]|nr:MAG: Response regulator receiver protein [Parcubacteria group bacterium GW2011_GWB1_40_14]KKR77993.1 MAG: Response regulator receiver protein [Parcubacteria group bacterium GW2011_GWA2_40_8]
MKKILFVEDEQALQRTISEALHREGFEVLNAIDGDSGARLAKTEKPDMILLDLILPRRSGFDVLKELKETEETKDIPVIVLTNLESPADVDRAIELGATTYLVKANYDLSDIVKKVKMAIGTN